MAIDWDPIKAALHAWMTASAGLPPDRLIWANRNAARLATPYAVINYRLAIARRGLYDEERLTDTPGTVLRVGQRELSISCHLFGEGAIARMEAAQDALETYATSAALAEAGLVILDRGRVRDLSALEDTQIEERAQLDVVLGLATSTSEDVGYIDAIELNAALHPAGAPDLVIPLDISVP